MTLSSTISRSFAPARADLQLRRAPSAAPQPRLNVHQLERFTPRFDELVHRAGLAVSQDDVDEVEADLAALCRDMRAVVGSPTPQRAPLLQTDEGCLW